MTNGLIKILHVVFSLEPGGMENGLVNVARGLPADQFEVHVCCLERSGLFARRLPQPQNVHELNKPEGFSMGGVLGLGRVISHLKPHVVHSHNLGPLIYSTLASGFGRRRPVLQGEHHRLRPEDCVRKRLRQRAWLYRCCHTIHTVSNGVRQELINYGFPAGKIVTLLNGVDSRRFTPGPRRDARRRIGGVPEKGFLMGIVGRIVPGKGHPVLIEAFSQLARARPDIHLLIIGDGGREQERAVTQAQATGVADRIHFSGFQDDVTSCYQAMDLLVAASTGEGLSNVVLEAMACGVPVLAHPACGNPEVISHGQDGVLAELDTVEKLRRELEKVLSRPEQLAAMGRAAREKMARQFTIERMVQDYEQLYRKLAGVT